jgi:hypothetical protein
MILALSACHPSEAVSHIKADPGASLPLGQAAIDSTLIGVRMFKIRTGSYTMLAQKENFQGEKLYLYGTSLAFNRTK